MNSNQPLKQKPLLLQYFLYCMLTLFCITILILCNSFFYASKNQKNFTTQAEWKAEDVRIYMLGEVDSIKNQFSSYRNYPDAITLSSYPGQVIDASVTAAMKNVQELLEGTAVSRNLVNVYLAFPNLDRVIMRGGSFPLSILDQHLKNLNSSYILPKEDSAVYQEILQGLRQFPQSEKLLVYHDDVNFYLLLSDQKISYMAVMNKSLLTQSLQKLLMSEEDHIVFIKEDRVIYSTNPKLFPYGELFALPPKSNYDSILRPFLGNSIATCFDSRTFLTELLGWNILSAVSLLVALGVMLMVFFRIKQLLYNPIHKVTEMLRGNAAEAPPFGGNEWEFISSSVSHYLSLSKEKQQERDNLMLDMSEILMGKLIGETQALQDKVSFPLSEYPYFFVFMLDVENREGQSERQLLLQQETALLQQFPVTKIFSMTYENAYLYHLKSEKDAIAGWESLKDFLEKLPADFLLFSASSCVPATEPIKGAYYQARKALLAIPHCSEYSRFRFSRYDRIIKEPSFLTKQKELENQLVNAVINQNTSQFFTIFDQFDLRDGAVSIGSQQKIYLSLFDILCAFLSESKQDFDIFPESNTADLEEILTQSYNMNYVGDVLRSLFAFYLKNNSPIKDGLLERIVAYVDENISRDISLLELAEEMNVTYTYIGRYIKKSLGMGFVEYLQMKKIEYAKRILTEQEVSVNEVASLTGFNTLSSFFRVFKKLTGMTPKEYRDSAGEKKI